MELQIDMLRSHMRKESFTCQNILIAYQSTECQFLALFNMKIPPKYLGSIYNTCMTAPESVKRLLKTIDTSQNMAAKLARERKSVRLSVQNGEGPTTQSHQTPYEALV